MWRHWKTIQTIIIINLMVTGLYPLCYNRKRHQIRISCLLQVYAIMHNIIILLLLPLQFYHSYRVNSAHPNMFPSTVYIDMVLILLRTASTAFTLLTRWQHERQLCDIVADLSRLDAKINSFKRQSLRMKKLMVTKMIVVCCILSYTFLSICILYKKRLLITKAGFAYFVNCVFLLNMTVLYYYALLWHISNLILQLNDQLLAVSKQVVDLPTLVTPLSYEQQTQLAADLFDLAAKYSQVAQLLVRLNDTFKFKLFATYFSYFVTIVSFFYLMLLLSTGFYPLGYFSLAVNFILFSICFADFLLFIILSDRITSYSADATTILSNFAGISSKEMLLIGRSSELVSLQLLACKYEVNVCGMFDMNRRTVFTIASSSLLYIIFLIQEDYIRKINA